MKNDADALNQEKIKNTLWFAIGEKFYGVVAWLIKRHFSERYHKVLFRHKEFHGVGVTLFTRIIIDNDTKNPFSEEGVSRGLNPVAYIRMGDKYPDDKSKVG